MLEGMDSEMTLVSNPTNMMLNHVMAIPVLQNSLLDLDRNVGMLCAGECTPNCPAKGAFLAHLINQHAFNALFTNSTSLKTPQLIALVEKYD